MKRFKDILCVLEPSKTSVAVLERAVVLAENNQANLTVVDASPRVSVGMGLPDGGPISAHLQAEMVSAYEQQLERLVAPYRGRLNIKTKALSGVPFLEIIREVLRNGRDLVIKAPEHQDWLDRFFGSDDMHLLRKCPCPVWLIKPQAAKVNRRILAAVDVDKGCSPQQLASQRLLNHQIIKMASSLALTESADLHIVHVWDAIGESSLRHSSLVRKLEQQVNTHVEQMRQQHADSLNALLVDVASHQSSNALDYLQPQLHLLKGWARKEIPALAKQIDVDLIVMGTVARTGVPGFIMGNTAETILNQINCSVLAIKPPGFVTPVTLEDEER